MEISFWIEYSEFLGQIRTDHPINGNGLIFKFGYRDYQNECILFIHPELEPFVTVDDKDIDTQLLTKAILSKWSKEDLLNINESKN